MNKTMTLVASMCVAAVAAYAEEDKGCCQNEKAACQSGKECSQTNKECCKGACKADQNAKQQTLCPVMGNEINKKLYVDYQGKRIYVCCKGCIDEVKKDPAKYVAQLEKEGVALDKTPDEAPAKATKESK